MAPGLSTYLNALRFGAAMIVLLSHFAYPRFSDGVWLWVRELNLGSDAVVLFFVLSGFVIALTAERKDATLGRFSFARATRIYSVAIPTLIVGWSLDQWGSSLAPEQYFAPYYAPLPLLEVLLRGLSFSNEWGGFSARLGSNGPYWSLSYEVGYYALFGVAFYLTGLRRIALLLGGVVVLGINIMLLMPAWLMGVWLYHRLKSAELPSKTVAVTLAVVPVVIYVVALKLNLPDVIKLAMQPDIPGHVLRFSDEYLWNALLGILICAHLYGMTGLLRCQPTVRLDQSLAWLAGGSFSLYLMHYPLLQFFHAALPDLSHAGLFGLTVLTCLAFAELFERPLHLWRRGLRSLGRLRQSPATG
jgi:peptidoglycan/LPS O-acetylase OafA/YrhL